MPPAGGWHSRGQELYALAHDLIGLVPSSTLSCRRASEEAGLLTAVVIGHW